MTFTKLTIVILFASYLERRAKTILRCEVRINKSYSDSGKICGIGWRQNLPFAEIIFGLIMLTAEIL